MAVTAAGHPPLRYQWSRDGQLLPGATNAVLLLPGFGTATAGAYVVRIENAVGAAQSPPASLVVAQLLFLEAENPKKEISLYINSPGGVVTAGLAIYDTMQFIRPPVSTLCIGQAASMGSLLLAAGAKDMRFALPNARVMVHQPSGGFQGQVTDILIHAREVEGLRKRLNEIYVRHTGRSMKEIEDALERDNFLSADAAREFGLIDKVLEKRPTPSE